MMKKIIVFTLVGAVTMMLMLSACIRTSKAYHIPENILKNMPTKELAETVLNSPLLMEMLVYDGAQSGFERVSSEYNGLSELLKRSDAGSEMWTIYNATNPAAVNDSRTDTEKGFYAFRIQLIETILAQEQVLQSLNLIKRHDLLGDCIVKYEEKQRFPEVYGEAESTLWLMGRILQRSGNAAFTQVELGDPSLQSFLSVGSYSGVAVRDEILSQARQYLAGS
jgi:hypothetical protein